jgi:ceramide glucosyltransferase
MLLAESIRARGRTTAMVPRAARSVAQGRTLGDVFDRFVRWTLVTRHQRAAKLLSYPIYFFPLLVLAVGVLYTDAPRAHLSLLIGVASRVLLAVAGALRGSAPERAWRSVVLAPVADALLACAWVRALCTTRIQWRGVAMRFGEGGRLERA